MKAMIWIGCVVLFAVVRTFIEDAGAELGAAPTVILVAAALVLVNVLNRKLQDKADERREAKTRK